MILYVYYARLLTHARFKCFFGSIMLLAIVVSHVHNVSVPDVFDVVTWFAEALTIL